MGHRLTSSRGGQKESLVIANEVVTQFYDVDRIYTCSSKWMFKEQGFKLIGDLE